MTLLERALIPFVKAPSSGPNYLLKVPFPKTITLGILAGHIQSVTEDNVSIFTQTGK